jgi:hypothetical protein
VEPNGLWLPRSVSASDTWLAPAKARKLSDEKTLAAQARVSEPDPRPSPQGARIDRQARMCKTLQGSLRLRVADAVISPPVLAFRAATPHHAPPRCLRSP